MLPVPEGHNIGKTKYEKLQSPRGAAYRFFELTKTKKPSLTKWLFNFMKVINISS